MADSEPQEAVDPLPTLREECQAHHCQKLKDKLDACNARVSSRSKTSETCHEEMVDLIECIDHCAMPKLFKKLK